MEQLYTLIAGLVMGAGGMYFVCRNNIKRLGKEKEEFLKAYKVLKMRLDK